jgi:hypothetical protein
MIGSLAISGSAGNQVQEFYHHRFRIYHPLIHVNVDDLGTAFYLLQGNSKGGFIIFG